MVSGSKTAEFVVRPSMLFLTYILEARQIQGGRAPQSDPVLRCFVSILNCIVIVSISTIKVFQPRFPLNVGECLPFYFLLFLVT